MKRAIPVLVAMLLIVIIGIRTFGGKKNVEETFSTETISVQEYFGVAAGEYAIINGTEITKSKALSRNNTCYLSYDDVTKYITDIFYLDEKNELIFYTDNKKTIVVNMGSTGYMDGETEINFSEPVSLYEKEQIWFSVNFLKKFANFECRVHPYRVVIKNEWSSHKETEVKNDTHIRTLGGKKGPVLRELNAGEKVEVVEEKDRWTKIRTSDDLVGFVEASSLGFVDTVYETPVTNCDVPTYEQHSIGKKVILGYHAIAGVSGNDTITTVMKDSKSMNVLAPTWFSLSDDEGGYRSFATSKYVKLAHNKGIQVWGVLDDFNYEADNETNIDVGAVMKNNESRKKLIDNIVEEAVQVGLDGISLDIETLPSDAANAYGQFLRELSLSCHQNNLIVSASNYVPYSYNEHYRMDIQGEVLDYVIIMGYDEHTHGSKDPGSVASLSYVTFGIDKTLQNVPKEKVINALPLYMIEWRIDGSDITDNYLIYNEAKEYLSSISASPHWDDTTNQNYLERKIGNATYKMWIEDSESLLAKINVMDTKDIAGAAIWRLGYDDATVWKLLDTYSKT